MKLLGIFSLLMILSAGPAAAQTTAQTAAQTASKDSEAHSWWFDQAFYSLLHLNRDTQTCETPPKLNRLSQSTKMSAYAPINNVMEGGKFDAYYNEKYLKNQEPNRRKNPEKWRAWNAKREAYKNQHRLHTLQEFLAGQADFVSVAIDNRGSMRAFKGKYVCIPSLDQSYQKEFDEWGKAHPAQYRKYGGHIPFKIVDTGHAFFDQKFSKIDICVGNPKPKKRKPGDPKPTPTPTLKSLMHDPRLQEETVLQDCDPLFRPSLSAND